MKLGTRFLSTALLLAFMLAMLPMGASTANAAPCYWAQFVADVTIPDGASFEANTPFQKTWRVRNIGACSWNSNDVSLVFDSGEMMTAPASLALPIEVLPGQTVDLTVNMTAPSAAGHYFGYWKFNSALAGRFGIGSTTNKSFWVEIYVTSPSSTGYDFTANASSATWSSGAGYLSFPGDTGSPNGFGIKQDAPVMESGVYAAQAGLLFSPQNIYNGYVQAAYPAFRVQSGDRFQATIGCEYGYSACYVAYSLYYQIGSGTIRKFWTFRERYEGLTYKANLDLSSLANQDVKFILAVSAYGSATGDRALWVNPIISRVGALPPTITPSPLPDLTISNVYLGMQGIPGNPTTCIPNYAPFEIRVTVLNRGQIQAVSIPVTEVSTGTQLTIGLLRAGESTEIYFPATLSGGTYNFVVDPQNIIPELNESNNVFSYLPITPTPPVICTPVVTPSLLPDLAISNVYLGMQGIPGSPTTCISDYAPFEVRVTIQNRGLAQAVSISVTEVSTGTQRTIGLLSAGQSTEIYFPGGLSGGTYNFVIDSQNTIPEIDESNNMFSYLPITPTPPVICTPVVTVTPTSPTPAPPSSGLKLPDSTTPTSGVCAEVQVGEVVEFTLTSDGPAIPRCAKVTGSQRIKLTNVTNAAIQINFSHFNMSIPAGSWALLDQRVNEYLAPGVHFLNGAEVWLVAATP
jgi:hypothetical protein